MRPDPLSPASRSDKPKAVFTTGSTMRHVVVMTSTASVGLVAIFLVDAINLFYIAMLGQQELAAAIGYAATIMFFTISVCIGLSIAATALVARALGAGREADARRMAFSSLLFLFVITVVMGLALWPALPGALALLGATGETQVKALSFMHIVLPSIPLMGFGMCAGALLRAKGDPRRAMYVTLSGGAAALVLDPLFIFGLDLGLEGAAISTVLTRCIIVAVGLHGLLRVHRMVGRYEGAATWRDLRPFAVIAAPAVLTQLATPVGNAYVTGAIASFGDDAVAGWAIVGRVLPVAFGTIFALSGAVGPILSQNLGAGLYGRITHALRDALIFMLIYCLTVWGLLALLAPLIISVFSASGNAALIVQTFCYIVAGSFLFNGMLFVANAVFNNLGFPFYATIFNWGRATLGVIPFVHFGLAYGPEGVLIGWGLGAVVFGVLAVVFAFIVVRRLPFQARAEQLAAREVHPTANSPFSSSKGASVGIG